MVAIVSVAVVLFAAAGWRLGWLREAIVDYRAHKGEWMRADSPLGRLWTAVKSGKVKESYLTKEAHKQWARGPRHDVMTGA